MTRRIVGAAVAVLVFALAGTASAGKGGGGGGKTRPDTSPPSVAVSAPSARHRT